MRKKGICIKKIVNEEMDYMNREKEKQNPTDNLIRKKKK